MGTWKGDGERVLPGKKGMNGYLITNIVKYNKCGPGSLLLYFFVTRWGGISFLMGRLDPCQ